MRIQLAHMYWQADYDIVWDTIADDIPGIVEAAAREHQPSERGPNAHDEDTTIPRWQAAAATSPADDPSDPLRPSGGGAA